MMDETIESFEPSSVGQILKSAREDKGISLEAVAKILCISKRQLISLEADSDQLVCDVYTLGFLRSYALFLGLNGDELVQAFKNKAAVPQTPRLSFPAPLPGRGMPSFRVLALSLLVILVMVAGWEWYGYQGAAPFPNEEIIVEATPAPPPQPAEEPIIITEQTSPPQLVPVGFGAESPKTIENIMEITLPSPVVLTATEEAWIEVKDSNGNLVLSRLFKPGETHEFKEPENLILKTGNAQGTQLTSGNKSYTFSGTMEGVKSNIPLDTEKWLEQSPETH